MIAVIDYGMGNLGSVNNALKRLGQESSSSSDPELILAADRVILPGVGAFEDAMKNLRERGLDQCIKEVVARQTPLLGICLGLQLLFDESHEHGLHQGLGIIPGQVRRFDIDLKVPHMGWSDIEINPASRLFKGIDNGSYFYFVHSFYVQPEDPAVAAATCDYGLRFTCAIEKGNLFATQFHPEKSGDKGIEILKNFLSLHA